MNIASLVVGICGVLISMLPMLFGNIQLFRNGSRAESFHKRLLKIQAQHRRFAKVTFNNGQRAEDERLNAAVEWAENASLILPFLFTKIIMRTLIICGAYLFGLIPLILWNRAGSVLPFIPSIEWHDVLGMLIAFLIAMISHRLRYFVTPDERKFLKQVYGVFNAYYELVISRSVKTLSYDYDRFFCAFDIYMKMEFDHAKDIVAEFREPGFQGGGPQVHRLLPDSSPPDNPDQNEAAK